MTFFKSITKGDECTRFIQGIPVNVRHLQLIFLISCLSILPMAGLIPYWIYAFFIFIYICKYKAILHNWNPPILLVNAIAIGVIGLLIATSSMVSFRDSWVGLLICIIGIRIFQSTNLGALILVGFLQIFLIVVGFSFSQSPFFAFTSLSVTFMLLMFFISISDLSFKGQRVKPMALGALKPFIIALPFAAILFLIAPRFNGSFIGLPGGSVGYSGVAEEMSPGSIGNLQKSFEPAFSVKFDNGYVPMASQLYWRGVVLWNYDGRTWTRMDASLPLSTIVYTGSIDPVSYQVIMEPTHRAWYFTLDIPVRGTATQGLLTKDFQLLSSIDIVKREQYGVNSYLNAHDKTPLLKQEVKAALQFPVGLNPRSQEFAKHLLSKVEGNKRDYVDRVLDIFGSGDYYYALKSGVIRDKDVIDTFLFEKKKGFCEMYSTAFTMLMRYADIPARVVVGYQGGEINEIGNFVTVRQEHAHAWVEIWDAEKGWVRVDPTAHVPPENVEEGANLVYDLTKKGGNSFLLGEAFSAWQDRYDYMVNSWNRFVLGYSYEHQLAIFEEAKLLLASVHVMIAVGLSFVILTGIFVYRRFFDENDYMGMAYAHLLLQTEKCGVSVAPHMGPRTLWTLVEGVQAECNIKGGRKLISSWKYFEKMICENKRSHQSMVKKKRFYDKIRTIRVEREGG